MKFLKAMIYVNDSLMADLGPVYMGKLLAAAIEAIFIMMGKHEIQYRKFPLAMDKRVDLLVIRPLCIA